MKRIKLQFLIVFSALFLTTPVLVKAQYGVRVPIRDVADNPKPAASSGRTTKVQKVFVPIKEVRTEKYKTSNLSVTTEPGAAVVLESSLKGKPPTRKTANADGIAIFEDVKPTTLQTSYEITVSLDGFETQHQDGIKVPPQKTLGMNFELKAITFQLVIDTNIKAGEVRYASTNSQGTETGGYCIVPIKNSRAVIKDLHKGFYNLDIRPFELEYQTILTSVNLGTDSDAADQTQSYRINLEKKISTDPFDASAWTQNSWNLPAGWRVQERRMTISGTAGVALPSSEQHRYYRDFEMISDVRSLDGKTVGFAFRALDPRNYYFIQISGSRAPDPLVASGFLVQEDRTVQIFSSPIEHLANFITPNKSFRVIVRSKGNVFKISLENSETGQTADIGEMTDRDDNLRKGAVGIASRGNSNFEVLSFTVLPR